MPRYYFHLDFGERRWPDGEGVELPDRSAARNEALAVIRDLSGVARKRGNGRWAGWFMEIADSKGAFLRLPVGHPALQVVAKDGRLLRSKRRQSRALEDVSGHDLLRERRAAALAERVRAISEKNAQLLQRTQRLQQDLMSKLRENTSIRLQSVELMRWIRSTSKRTATAAVVAPDQPRA